MFFGYAKVLLPQRLEWYRAIPFDVLVLFVKHPIRQVANHRVDAPVGNLSHPLQAVLIVDFIQFYHNVPFRLKPL